MIYLIPLILMLFGVFRLDLKNVPDTNPTYKKLWVACFWLLVLIPGLSYRIGIDTPSYMYFYENIRPIWEASFKYLSEVHDDFLWALFCSICKSISPEYAFMHTVQCLILHISVFHFIKKLTSARFIALLLYYVVLWSHSTFGALRESMAIALYLWALTNLIQGKSLFKYILIAVPAIFFHRFAFIAILLTPVFYEVRRLKWIIPILLVTGVFVAFNLETFINMFFQSMINDNVRMAYYMETNLAGGERQMNIIGIAYYIITLTLPPLLIIILLRQEQNSKQYEGIIMILAFAIILGIVASIMSDFRRIYNYFLLLQGVLFANIIQKRSHFHTSYLSTCYKGLLALVVFMEISACVNFYKPSVIEYRKGVNYDVYFFPYHSVITKETDPMREAVHMIEH